MQNEENTKYYKIGITAAAVVAFGCVFFFILEHIDNLSMANRLLAGILRPFMYGGVIAYLVTPLSRKLGKLFKKPQECMVADILALLIALFIIIGIILLIVPQIISSISGIIQSLPHELQKTESFFEKVLNDNPNLLEMIQDATDQIQAKLNEMMSGDISDKLNKVMGVASGAVSTATGILSVFKDLLIGLIIALYILTKRTQLAAQASMIIKGTLKPAWADWVINEVHFADRVFNGFFIGKIFDSAIIGVLCFLGCLIMRFDAPLLIAVIIGITNIIPFFGPFIGAIPCALLLLLENPTHCLMFIVFVVVLQQLDGNVIGPKILGDTTGLPALWVMFGILLFGGLWGIIGMLVGVPLMAIIYDIIRQLTFRGIRKKGRSDIIDSYNARFHPDNNNNNRSS